MTSTTRKTGKSSGRSPDVGTRPPAPQRSAAYEGAIRDLTAAIEHLHRERVAEALAIFRRIAAEHGDEFALAERARTYSRICEGRLAGPGGPPETPEDLYRHGVAASNAGRFDDAVALLGQAVSKAPGDASYLYARAAALAQTGDAHRASEDLRRAIQIEPRLRFQAGNDPDFERVRDEAIFIDVIEPSPAGA